MEEQNWPSLTTIRQMTKEVQSNKIDYVFHNGDISYSYGFLYGWDYFGSDVENMSSTVPYMVSIGNHEYGYFGSPFHTNWTYYDGEDSGGECGIPYLKRFHMPDNGVKNLWYSYKYGAIHVIVLSLEHDFTKNSEQYNWIKKDLENNTSPWTMLFSHRPMYTSSSLNYVGDNRMAFHIQRELEEILLGKVDIFVGGHYHAYERTCKMNNYQCNESNGIIHALVGSGGYLDEYPFREPKPEWSIYRNQIYGYSIVHANETFLNFQFLTSDKGEVVDEFFLRK
jgi:acid phosphatase type 7